MTAAKAQLSYLVDFPLWYLCFLINLDQKLVSGPKSCCPDLVELIQAAAKKSSNRLITNKGFSNERLLNLFGQDGRDEISSDVDVMLLHLRRFLTLQSSIYLYVITNS